MSNKLVKFVFNQTAHFAGAKYSSGDMVEMPEHDAQRFKAHGFGNLKSGNKKEKHESISK